MSINFDFESTRAFAALVPRITGSISAVSSSLIIYLIYRSKPKLSTIYHRIMFGMSVADIMASTAMALTTLPMPRNDDPYWMVTYWEDDDIIWSDHTKLGTRQTCAAQGFFFSTGITIMFSYNGMLCVYYACAIAFRMKDAQIRKKIEPFIHGFPLLTGLAPVIPSFVYGFYNPNGEDSWCTLYPAQVKWRTLFALSMLVNMGGLFVMILICFTLIIWRVIQNGRQLSQADSRGDIQIDERFKAAHRNTRLIISQSLAYTGALLLTLIFPIVRMLNSQMLFMHYSIYLLLTKLMFIFMPLQGFFNFTIFLWHKVENYRRANPAIGLFHVVRLLFTSCAEEPVLISRLSKLKVDEEEKRLEAEVYDELEVDELEVELDRLEMYDDLGERASRQSGGGLSGVDTIAGPASIGEAVIASPDLRIEQDRAPTPFRRKGGQGVENDSFQSDGDLSMGSRDLSQSYISRSIFSLSLFSGERSRGNASRSLGGGSGLSHDEP